MKQVQIGTTIYYDAPDGVARPGYVLYSGPWVVDTDGVTALMVWDGAPSVRPMTAGEIAALPAQRQAARDAAEPDLATLRDNAVAAFNANVTYLAIVSPTNAQAVAQTRALTQQMQQVIKALGRLVSKVL